jgi:hypothetical protein
MAMGEQSYLGDAALAGLLKKSGSTADLRQIRGILAGVIAAPEGERPDDWIDLVAPAADEPTRAQLRALKRQVASSQKPAALAPGAPRLAALRQELARRGLSGFLVPRADEHQGEYVPPRAERLAWLTGFSGSAGLAIVLADMKLDSTAIAAGLLHDAIEDTPVTHEDVRREFGDQVVHIVEGVTKIDKIDLASREERQAENVRKMVLAMVDDIRVVLIKLADRLHNMRTLEHLPPDRQQKIARETLDIYGPIAHRLGMGKIRGEVSAASTTALYPQIVAIEESTSMLCARVVRGINSTENETTPLEAISWMVSIDPSGRKNPISAWPRR